MACTNRRTKLGTAFSVLLWGAALGVLAENIVLARQNRRLRELAAPQIAAGTQLQMLSGLALDGHVQPVSLPPNGSKLLIIEFSPGCPACQANLEGWMKLAGTLKQNGDHVLWMSRDPIDVTRGYCMKHGIPLSDTLAEPPFRTYTQLGLVRVPNTVLVGPGGKVEKVWAGRLDQAGWETMFAYFGMSEGMAAADQNAAAARTAACQSVSSRTSSSCN